MPRTGEAPVILLAPGSFKGTFPAAAVADALAAGVSAEGGRPDRCPVADGGEGTIAVLLAATGGSVAGGDASGSDCTEGGNGACACEPWVRALAWG